MNQRRKYERLLFKCPEVNCYDVLKYPLVSEERFLIMEDYFKTDESTVHIFPFVCMNPSKERFIDIYVWDAALSPEGISFRRFLICENQRLCEEEEDLLFHYLNGCFVSWDIDDLFHMNCDIKQTFPEWHIIRYCSRDLNSLLAHCYFASHRCGPRETLFKSLPHIACNYDKLPMINLIGTNPGAIIGHGLPLRLLQILDGNPDLTCKLYNEASIEICKKAYLKYRGFFSTNTIPTKAQYEYLEDLVQNGRFAKYGFNRTIYCQLGIGDYSCLDMYADFLCLREQVAKASQVPEVKELKIPIFSAVESVVSKLKQIANCETSYKEENCLIIERQKKEKAVFEYSGEKYSIILPKSVLDFYKEGIVQGNCLISENYAASHAHGQTTVVFLRKNNSLSNPFVTIEIRDEEIIQVRGRFNSLPTPSREIFEFLDEYSENSSLLFFPIKIISENADDPDDLDDDFREYVESRKKLLSKGRENEVPQMVFEAFEDLLSIDLTNYELIIHEEKKEDENVQ